MRSSAAILLSSLTLYACGPEIGDDCSDSLDCATDGSRYCDTTQPDGYCLIPGCRADECPEEAVCVRFGEDERARTFCMAHCGDSGDCRGGYSCMESGSIGDLMVEIIDDAPHGSTFCMERVPDM